MKNLAEIISEVKDTLTEANPNACFPTSVELKALETVQATFDRIDSATDVTEVFEVYEDGVTAIHDLISKDDCPYVFSLVAITKSLRRHAVGKVNSLSLH